MGEVQYGRISFYLNIDKKTAEELSVLNSEARDDMIKKIILYDYLSDNDNVEVVLHKLIE